MSMTEFENATDTIYRSNNEDDAFDAAVARADAGRAALSQQADKRVTILKRLWSGRNICAFSGTLLSMGSTRYV